MRLFDHFRFRDAMKDAHNDRPLTLQGPDGNPKWWQPYFDSKDVKSHDRKLFARAPVAAAVPADGRVEVAPTG